MGAAVKGAAATVEVVKEVVGTVEAAMGEAVREVVTVVEMAAARRWRRRVVTVEAAKAEVGTAGVGTVAVEMEEAMGEGKVGVMEGVMAAEVMAVVETAEAVKGVEETEEGVRRRR